MGLNQAQLKLLANFCSEVAKGALLTSLGFSYVLPESIFIRAVVFISGISTAAFMLYFAVRIAKLIKDHYE